MFCTAAKVKPWTVGARMDIPCKLDNNNNCTVSAVTLHKSRLSILTVSFHWLWNVQTNLYYGAMQYLFMKTIKAFFKLWLIKSCLNAVVFTWLYYLLVLVSSCLDFWWGRSRLIFKYLGWGVCGGFGVENVMICEVGKMMSSAEPLSVTHSSSSSLIHSVPSSVDTMISSTIPCTGVVCCEKKVQDEVKTDSWKNINAVLNWPWRLQFRI